MSEEESDVPQPSAPISAMMLLCAGAGSISAQRDVRDTALRLARSGEAPFVAALTVAETAGWMASRSGEAADLRELALIELSIAGDNARPMGQRIYCHGQSLSFLDLAADAGDAEAVSILADVVAAAPPQVVADAKSFKAEWLATLASLNAQIERNTSGG